MDAERDCKAGKHEGDAILIVGKRFPKTRQALRNRLGVEMIEITKSE